ncbi:MAG: LytTR family DNA-binding domain-containing protein [Bacteroidota bacterium]|nr:LytTR family DNA-binding domain-containing protein [Bacteroidota bacterium]
MTVLIVENELDIRNGLRTIISHYCPNITDIVEAKGVVEGLEMIQKHKPNILITDVELNDGTSIEMLTLIPNLNFPIIFITAYNKYAVDAFRFSAIDFLLKPIEPLELIKAINKALENINIKNTIAQLMLLKESVQNNSVSKKIVLKESDNMHFVPIDTIIFCKADGNYTHFELINGDKIMVSRPLGEYESMLDGYQFVRAHHSYLVNLKHVRTFNKSEGDVLFMVNGAQVPVSLRKKERIIQLLME